ncbi:ImmA/IrrE family metallo-endopeptidase [Rhizobium brockwellii]|uniref:ImmA/IrrE family metallo-endopeptidase n=1 Tax=Rhizobium brockwellii TaxID=3019932 RepID=A0ABU3YLG9_9HYPH|nr:ImmA/IrrE family metallo-endopeptidase [Rhizobium brockwellii]MDV4179766.1 ImmA/IrrE family metallo-endopeptidase [Rhizobium brockwellii]MDV4186688.1 ImmA/IrrE family metallo-endopeptidase [Rhizobium brockwellii]
MPSTQSADWPEKAAASVLERFRLGDSAPIPVDKIAKGLGALVRYSPLDNELSGMIYIKDGTPIIGVNALHHINRQRFTIAHECGHLELHRDLLSSQVHVDKEFSVPMLLNRDHQSSLGTEPIEIQANRFAAALLVPHALLQEILDGRLASVDIDDESPLDELARKFRVSKSMMEYRLKSLSATK